MCGGYSRLSSRTFTVLILRESLPHEPQRALRLPRLPRAERALAERGPRRPRAARSAREGTGRVDLLPHLGRAPAPARARRSLPERLLAVGWHRGPRRAARRAAGRNRSLPCRLDGAR